MRARYESPWQRLCVGAPWAEKTRAHGRCRTRAPGECTPLWRPSSARIPNAIARGLGGESQGRIAVGASKHLHISTTSSSPALTPPTHPDHHRTTPLPLLCAFSPASARRTDPCRKIRYPPMATAPANPELRHTSSNTTLPSPPKENRLAKRASQHLRTHRLGSRSPASIPSSPTSV